MGYRLNRLDAELDKTSADETVFMAVLKPLPTEFGIHYKLESCALSLTK